MNSTAEKLLTFIKESPTAFQAVEMMKKRFGENGFTELKEDEHWELVKWREVFCDPESFCCHCVYGAGGFQRCISHYCKPQRFSVP